MSNEAFLRNVKLLVQMHAMGLLGGEVMPEQHRVALQPNRHPEIWQRVSEGITRSSPSGDVIGLIESVQFDIAALKNIIQITRKAEFPYLFRAENIQLLAVCPGEICMYSLEVS